MAGYDSMIYELQALTRELAARLDQIETEHADKIEAVDKLVRELRADNYRLRDKIAMLENRTSGLIVFGQK